MTFGERLRYLLERRDIQQKEIAHQLNITASTFNGYVNDYRLPNLLLIVRMAEFFGVTTDYLLGCESTPESIPLSNDERGLLSNLRSLDKEQQEIIFKLAEMLTKK
ncbi:MAG: helix-turn-helix transcriptional regulator [Ruminococcaceae bacterium]|nr:helix-turn-helix transcriptional regulator [Oscillospiraceae bacterium]